MSDPERRYFEQVALDKYPEKEGSASALGFQRTAREAFVSGATFSSQFISHRREVAADDAKLRDAFAMAALQICVKDLSLGHDAWASEAYSVADSMMAERAKGMADG